MSGVISRIKRAPATLLRLVFRLWCGLATLILFADAIFYIFEIDVPKWLTPYSDIAAKILLAPFWFVEDTVRWLHDLVNGGT